MRKRDEIASPDSCWNKAHDDEWVFVLLGRDLAATVAVKAWIAERLRLGKNTPDDAKIREAKSWIACVLEDQEGEECGDGSVYGEMLQIIRLLADWRSPDEVLELWLKARRLLESMEPKAEGGAK